MSIDLILVSQHMRVRSAHMKFYDMLSKHSLVGLELIAARPHFLDPCEYIQARLSQWGVTVCSVRK